MAQCQDLFIVNSSDRCLGGLITRSRKVGGDQQVFCIDFIITSKDLAKHLESAMIDSNIMYSLTKYITTMGIPSVKRSDHYIIMANFTMEWSPIKAERVE